jgi:hypothetical protein
MSALPTLIRGVPALLLLLLCGGCTYRGAIYASYQEAGLGIKATAESTAPIKVHFGYDRGVGAWVPRRGGSDEEATSLISRDDVRAGVNPTNTSQALLETDGVVISGTAAIVASAPAGAVVRVTEADAVAGEAAGDVLRVKTEGTAGNRLAAALSQAELSDEQADLRELILQVEDMAHGDRIFRDAAARLPPAFRKRFRTILDEDEEVSVAFKRATDHYTVGATEHVPTVMTALRAAINAN